MSQTFPAGVSADEFYARADALSQAVRELAQQGWTPATSSNFSIRMDENHAAITISGRDKTRLSRDDMMLVDMQGKAVGTASRPSAETELHTHAYLRWPNVNVVLHTHSRVQSIASRLFAKEGVIRFEGWELQKAISGYTTHESVLEVPVFPNTQHMPELVAQVDAWLDAGKPLHAYLINGHGIYTWGKDVQEAKRHLEALEFLLDCELELRRLSA